MRVLITNFVLSTRSGSELYAFDVASALLARGHSPVLYSPVLGRLAADIRSRSIPVVSDVRDITPPPDVIHGQHNHETMVALLHFPGVPAVRFCHGWFDQRPWQFPRIVSYVAVDHTVRERMIGEWGIPDALTRVVYNFVDLQRFPCRETLSPRPARGLVFSNTGAEHLPALRRACHRFGITVDAIGEDSGNPSSDPAAVLHRYDVVFAKARCAIEAMATGAAVILCDGPGLGPLVTTANVDELRRLNFGWRTLSDAVSEDGIARELEKYDAVNATAVARHIRSTADLSTAIERILEIYEEATQLWAQKSTGVSPEDELRSAGGYVQEFCGPVDARTAVASLARMMFFRFERAPLLHHLMPRRHIARRIQKVLRRS